MNNKTEIELEWSPEIPESNKLGRKHLSSLSSEAFWVMLIREANPMDYSSEPMAWERQDLAEEYLGGDELPTAFNLDTLKSPKRWTAFSWENGCVEVGVLQHAAAGLCRPFC